MLFEKREKGCPQTAFFMIGIEPDMAKITTFIDTLSKSQSRSLSSDICAPSIRSCLTAGTNSEVPYILLLFFVAYAIVFIDSELL